MLTWVELRQFLTALNCVCLFPSLIQQLDPPQKEQLLAALTEMDFHMRKLADIPWLWQFMEPSDEEVTSKKKSRSPRERVFHFEISQWCRRDRFWYIILTKVHKLIWMSCSVLFLINSLESLPINFLFWKYCTGWRYANYLNFDSCFFYSCRTRCWTIPNAAGVANFA